MRPLCIECHEVFTKPGETVCRRCVGRDIAELERSLEPKMLKTKDGAELLIAGRLGNYEVSLN